VLLDNAAGPLELYLASPNSSEFPVVGIVIYLIVRSYVGPKSPLLMIPRTPFDAPETPYMAVSVSPKSMKLPVEAMVAKSIIF